LLEALPGIANVLRSPVADAMLNVIRAAARLGEFQIADAEELIRYATRRNLLGAEEGERVLAEVRAQAERRAERANNRTKASKARTTKGKPKPKPKPVARKAGRRK
jgi:urease accessory protein UreF